MRGLISKELWKLGRLNHVAIATLNLEKSVDFYKNILGGDCSGKVDLPEHGVSTVFVNLGNTKVRKKYTLEFRTFPHHYVFID